VLASGVASAAPDVAALRGELAGADVGRARDAVAELARIRQPAAAEALLDALAMGLPPDVAAAALDAVAVLRPKGARDVLLGYTRHRGAELRARAVTALAAQGDPGARPALLAALGDLAPEVRAAAGSALAARRDRGALPPLLALFARGDETAAAPLAALADGEAARQAAELSGKVPDALLARTLGLMLLRPDLGGEPIYVAVVRAVGAIPGDAALTALSSFLAAQPGGGARPSAREARALLDARAGR
jgi:HEAT repeat protein